MPSDGIFNFVAVTFASTVIIHDDVIKWKHFPRYWSFVRGIHWHKCQWRGALKFSLICTWINSWVNNREAGDLRRHRAHYEVTVMSNAGPINAWRRHDMKTLTPLRIFVRGIYRSPVVSTHKGPVIRRFEAFFIISLKNAQKTIRHTVSCRWFVMPWRIWRLGNRSNLQPYWWRYITLMNLVAEVVSLTRSSAIEFSSLWDYSELRKLLFTYI